MNLDSKKKLTSTTPGFEEVVFTLKKMSEGRRSKLKLSQADAIGRIRTLMVEVNALLPAVEGGEVSPLDNAKAQTLYDSVNLTVETEINPSWIRWGLDKIEGLNIDGEPATVESFIENAPSDLFTEVLTAIRNEAELSPEERKN